MGLVLRILVYPSCALMAVSVSQSGATETQGETQDPSGTSGCCLEGDECLKLRSNSHHLSHVMFIIVPPDKLQNIGRQEFVPCRTFAVFPRQVEGGRHFFTAMQQQL